MRKMILYPLVAFVGLTAAVGSVFAHAHTESTEPRDGDKLPSSPAEIAVQFGSAVESALSTITVTTDTNQAIDLGPIGVSEDEKTLSARPVTTLPPDVYHVRWKALSRDGHPASGEFSFTVSK